MKAKKLLALALSCVCALGAFALAGCSGGSNASSDGSGSSTGGAISVISREDGSGTRGAFTELFGIEDADGNDATTTSAVVTNSTSVMMTTVAGDPSSIGYISLGLFERHGEGRRNRRRCSERRWREGRFLQGCTSV